MNTGRPMPRIALSPDSPWRIRLWIAALAAVTFGVIWTTNAVLTERYSTATRSEAEVRLALFSGGLMSELRRSSIVPQLLSRDPLLIGALDSGEYATSSQRLIEYQEEIGVARLLLLDAEGRAVASSDRLDLGSNLADELFTIEALRANGTVFTTVTNEVALPRFYYARKIDRGQETLGIIVVEVDLRRYERSWAGIAEAVIVTDSEGVILLTTEPRWRGKVESEAVQQSSDQGALDRLSRARLNLQPGGADLFVAGQAVMRSEARIPFQGWQIIGFTSFTSVRERVNTVLAFEIMAFAILTAGIFYLVSRQADRRSATLLQESEELKKLNRMLQHEIAEREKAEKNLEVAELSLAQSSKLAALGEMSAAVSHELNQPLAAMKTYLAGARLLLRRHRADEAISSFQRIDDLIERMASITRQLKSYAGKGNERPVKVDLRVCVTNALDMMSPQLRRRKIRITRSQPDQEVWVLADQVRLEQVLVNLLRNAVDATKEVADPEIDVIMSLGETATLTVRDNGSGIANLEALFEPFYTTKGPGDGLGLGLAISSSIVSDLGGRLTARNRSSRGAVFEVQLPCYDRDSVAAE